MLISATAHCSRFVGNSSVVTARGARATAAMPTRWRLAWWTAARTLSLCAWITSKAAAAETSASTSIPRLTCKPGSRLHSTKPVKIQHLQPWWVHLCDVTGTDIFFSFFFFFKQKIHICQGVLTSAAGLPIIILNITNQHSSYLLYTALKQEKNFLFSAWIFTDAMRDYDVLVSSMQLEIWYYSPEIMIFMNVYLCACVWACTVSEQATMAKAVT